MLLKLSGLSNCPSTVPEWFSRGVFRYFSTVLKVKAFHLHVFENWMSLVQCVCDYERYSWLYFCCVSLYVCFEMFCDIISSYYVDSESKQVHITCITLGKSVFILYMMAQYFLHCWHVSNEQKFCNGTSTALQPIWNGCRKQCNIGQMCFPPL